MSKLRSILRTRTRRQEESAEYGFLPEIVSYPLGSTFIDADIARFSFGDASIDTQLDGSRTLVSLHEPPLASVHRLNGQVLDRIMGFAHTPNMFAFWDTVDRHKTLLKYGMSICRSWRYTLWPQYCAVMAYRIVGDGTLVTVPELPPTVDRSTVLNSRILILDIAGQPNEQEFAASAGQIVGESAVWSQVRTLYLNIDLGNGSVLFSNTVLTAIRLLARTVGERTPKLHTIWYNSPHDDVVASHRHMFSRILNPRIRHINCIHVSSSAPFDLELTKHIKAVNFGRLDVTTLTSNLDQSLVHWLAPSLASIRLGGLTLGRLVDILAEPSVDQYIVFQTLERLRLEFDETPLPEGMALGERNSLHMFPALRVLEIGAFAYDIQVFLRLFAGARKLTTLAMAECNRGIADMAFDQLPDTLRNLRVSFDMAKWTDPESRDAVQGLVDRIFQTQLPIETLVLGIANTPHLLNLPIAAIWHWALRDLTIAAPVRFRRLAKFISLFPNLHTLHLDLVDDGDDDGENGSDTHLPHGPISESLRLLHLTAVSTAMENARLEFGIVLVLARIPSIRTLIAPTLTKRLVQQCIRYVTSNELITNSGGHLHNLKCRCAPE
ncbi:hypothetical protein EC988_000586 [Linderina pennispora]|nr:hypothetical protein EC988_000586 [Linderina pennispora]